MVTTTAPEKILVEAPQRRQMSYEEYLNFAGDSQIVEWVDGEVIIYMPPVDKHQDVSQFLGTLLNLFIHFFKLGIMRYAPFEVKLWPGGPSREPDIIFIANENIAKLTPERFEGGPDLLIEIILPGSVTGNKLRLLSPGTAGISSKHISRAGIDQVGKIVVRCTDYQRIAANGH